MKKRVAVWTYGGIGAGEFSQGYPMLVKLVEALAEAYKITVFSFVSPDKDFRPLGYEVKSPPSWIRIGFLRWVCLCFIFIFHYLESPFHLLLAFWTYPVGFIATRFGQIFHRPVVVNVLGAELADLPEIQYGQLRISSAKKRILWTLRRATAVITISRFQADIIHALGIDRPLQVVPWGADPVLFPFAGKSWDELRILHVANLNPVKDQATLLRAFATIRKIRRARLRIVGADFLNQQIHKMVKDLNLEADVEFTGPLPYGQVAEHYQWANVMVHTSLYEGQCMALTEAASAGLLLAGTDVGILHDLGENSGIVVKPKDHEELAKCLLEALSDPVRCRMYVEQARKWSAAHNFRWTVDQLDGVILNLIHSE